MIGEQLDIQGKLKPVERRLATLKKHIEQSDIYFKYRGKKKLTEAEQILFTAARDYLKGVMNGKTTNSDKGMERGICHADRRAENAQSAVSCTQRGSERSRADTKECLQYLAAGTEGTRTAQNAGYGAVTDRAAG